MNKLQIEREIVEIRRNVMESINHTENESEHPNDSYRYGYSLGCLNRVLEQLNSLAVRVVQ